MDVIPKMKDLEFRSGIHWQGAYNKKA